MQRKNDQFSSDVDAEYAKFPDGEAIQEWL
jgi:hypothetical protein